jgi:hypothetical protein
VGTAVPEETLTLKRRRDETRTPIVTSSRPRASQETAFLATTGPDPTDGTSMETSIAYERWNESMIILGVLLVILGVVLKISILYTIGIILLVVGVIFWILGSVGRPIGGRKYWY